MTACDLLPLAFSPKDGMSATRGKDASPRNFFYVALVLVAVLFTLTACGYGVAMLIGVRSSDLLTANPAAVENTEHPLLALMDAYGLRMMIWELGLLAVCTALAIGLDARRERQAHQNPTSSSSP